MIQSESDLYVHYRTGRSMFSNANALYQHSPAPDHQHTLMLRSSVVDGQLTNAQYAAGLLRQASYALLNDVVNSRGIKMVAEPLAKMFGIGDLGEMLQHVKHLAETMFYVAEIVETREVSDLDLATYKIFQRGLINESGAISLKGLVGGSFELQLTTMLESPEIQNINTFLKYLVWGMGPLHALQPSASAGLSENYKQIQDGGFYEKATEAVAGLPAALQAKYEHLPAEQYQQYQLDGEAQSRLLGALCGAFMRTQMEMAPILAERESYTIAVCNLYDHYFQYEQALIEGHNVSILQGLKEHLDQSLKELCEMYPDKEVGHYLHRPEDVPKRSVFSVLHAVGESIGVSEANLKDALRARLSETAYARLELDGVESALPGEKMQSAQVYMQIETILQDVIPEAQELIRIRALEPNVIEHLLSSILKSQGIEGNEEKLKTLCATCLEAGILTQQNLINAGYERFLPSPPVSPVPSGVSSEERDLGDEPLGADGLQAEAAVAEAARVAAEEEAEIAAAEAAQERVQTAAALEIQRHYRGHAARETERKTSSARLIQAAFRDHTARRTALKDKTAAVVKIQALARGKVARAKETERKTSRSATLIQAAFRGHAARTEAAQETERKTRSATRIQAAFRGRTARTDLKNEAQALARGHVLQTKAVASEPLLTDASIQALYRSLLNCRSVYMPNIQRTILVDPSFSGLQVTKGLMSTTTTLDDCTDPQLCSGLLRQAAKAILDTVHGMSWKMASSLIPNAQDYATPLKKFAFTLCLAAEVIDHQIEGINITPADVASLVLFQQGLTDQKGSLHSVVNIISNIKGMLNNSILNDLDSFAKFLIWNITALGELKKSGGKTRQIACLANNANKISSEGFNKALNLGLSNVIESSDASSTKLCATIQTILSTRPDAATVPHQQALLAGGAAAPEPEESRAGFVDLPEFFGAFERMKTTLVLFNQALNQQKKVKFEKLPHELRYLFLLCIRSRNQWEKDGNPHDAMQRGFEVSSIPSTYQSIHQAGYPLPSETIKEFYNSGIRLDDLIQAGFPFQVLKDAEFPDMQEYTAEAQYSQYQARLLLLSVLECYNAYQEASANHSDDQEEIARLEKHLGRMLMLEGDLSPDIIKAALQDMSEKAEPVEEVDAFKAEQEVAATAPVVSPATAVQQEAERAQAEAAAEVQAQELEVVKIQALARGNAARTALKDETAAAVKIQAFARGNAARIDVAKAAKAQETERKTSSARRIQAAFRGHTARTALEDETAAAVKIQALARGKAVRTAAGAQAKQAAVVVSPGVQSAEAVQLTESSASLASRLEEVPGQNTAADLGQAPKEKTQSTHWAKISLGVGVLATTGIGLALAIQTKAIIVPAMITAPSFFAHGLVSTLGAITSPWVVVGVGALGGLVVAGIMLVGWKIYSGIRGRTSKENDASVGPREKNPEPMASGVVAADVVSSTLRGNDARAERSGRDNDPSGVVPPRPS